MKSGRLRNKEVRETEAAFAQARYLEPLPERRCGCGRLLFKYEPVSASGSVVVIKCRRCRKLLRVDLFSGTLPETN